MDGGWKVGRHKARVMCKLKLTHVKQFEGVATRCKTVIWREM